jgi:hypothetical protein
MATYAGEFTPEITNDYLSRLEQSYAKTRDLSAGRARGNALDRGLEGDPTEAIGVLGAENQYNQSVGDSYSNLAMQVAGMGRDERLTDENNLYKTGEREAAQAWQSGENEKQRSFDERMMAAKAAWERDAARKKNRTNWGSVLGGVAGAGAGVLAGGGWSGAELGAKLGSGLGGSL